MFIFSFGQEKPSLFPSSLVETAILKCLKAVSYLSDRVNLLTSCNSIVLYYLSLGGCVASLGMYSTRYSISSVLFMPNADRSSSTVSRNSWVHLIVNTLSFGLSVVLDMLNPILYIHYYSVYTLSFCIYIMILFCIYKINSVITLLFCIYKILLFCHYIILFSSCIYNISTISRLSSPNRIIFPMNIPYTIVIV